MKSAFKSAIPIMMIVTFHSGCTGQINVSDDFEAPRLSKIWTTDRMVPESFEIQSAVVRSGRNAAKITLRTGDVHEESPGKSKPTERDELREADNLVSHEGLKYEYQFSEFLPLAFPVTDTRLVIAQWKQYCPGGAACSDNSPVVAIRYVSGELFITLNTDSGSRILYKTDEEMRNRWLDFRFQIRFSRQNNGEIIALLNNNEIVNYKGITSYSEKGGYSPSGRYYFKMGLYRDVMAEPMTIFIDDYRKKLME